MEQVTWNAVNTAKIQHCQHKILAMYNWATCYNIHLFYVYIYEAESKSEVYSPVEAPATNALQNLVAVSATTY